jgi:hypothetical protein
VDKTGRLKISNGESRLDGTLLARKGAANPLGAATDFLTNLGLNSGDCTHVTGKSGSVGDAPVIFIDSANGVDEAQCAGAVADVAMQQLASADLVSSVPTRSSTRTKKTKNTRQTLSKRPKGPRSKPGKKSRMPRKPAKAKNRPR